MTARLFDPYAYRPPHTTAYDTASVTYEARCDDLCTRIVTWTASKTSRPRPGPCQCQQKEAA